MRFWMIPILALAVAAGCGSNDEPAGPAGADPAGDLLAILYDDDPTPIRVDDPVSDPYELVSATVAGDVLLVTVRYAGGCEEHEFELTAGGFGNGTPVSLDALLVHDANGDACEALITDTLRFDLKSVRRAFLRLHEGEEPRVQICVAQSVAHRVCALYEFAASE